MSERVAGRGNAHCQSELSKSGRSESSISTQPSRDTSPCPNGAEPLSSPSPDDFGRMLRGEVDRYTQLVQGLGIKLD